MAPSPVLLLGEQHHLAEHYRIERDTLRHVKGLGYDTLALELPADYTPAFTAYLGSHRTRKDFEALGRATHHQTIRDPEFIKMLWLAEDAHDLGYRVTCIDLPRAKIAQREDEALKTWVTRRNYHMADRIGHEVERHGAQVVVATGMDHLLTTALNKTPDRQPFRKSRLGDHDRFPSRYTPLPEALRDRGLEHVSFILAHHGEEAEALEEIRRSRTKGTLAHSGREIGRLVREKFFEGVEFERVPPVPGPHWGIRSRDPETLRKATAAHKHFEH